MVKQSWSIVCVCFTFFVSACASTPKAPEIPPQVQTKSSAVFKLVVLSKTPLAEFDQVHYDFLLQEASKGDFLDFLYGERVKECQKQKLSHCPIYFAGFASAFTTDEGRELWSVRHAFDPVIQRSLDQKQKRNSASLEAAHADLLHSKPNFLLFDEFKTLVYDTRKKNDQAQFDFVGNPFLMQDFVFQEFFSLSHPQEASGPGTWQSELRLAMAGKLTDFVKIRLSRSLGEGSLRFANSAPTIGESVFLLGYPSRTERSLVAKQRYYDGHSFHAMAGRRTSARHQFHQIFKHYEGDPKRDEKVLALFDRYFFYHDVPIVEGFSGGPILNANGEVISIQSSGSDEGGFGLNPQWIQTLEKSFATVNDL